MCHPYPDADVLLQENNVWLGSLADNSWTTLTSNHKVVFGCARSNLVIASSSRAVTELSDGTWRE